MAATTDARYELIEALRDAGLNVLDHPTKVGANCVAIQTVDPQIVYVPNLGGKLVFTYSLEIHVIGGRPDVAGSLEPVEQMVETVLQNIGDWDIDNVTSARPVDGGDQVFLGVTLSVSNTIHIIGGGQ